MRPWLVVTGAALLLVGGSALAAMVFLPPTGVPQLSTTTLIGTPTPPNTVGTFTVTDVPTVRGTLSLTWSSTAPVTVNFGSAGCPSGAPGCTGRVLHGWVLNSSGSFDWTGNLQPSYILSWLTPPKVFANVSATASVSWTITPVVSVAQVTAEVASGLLAVVGALGLFLGLFLRGGFRNPAPMVSRSADDAGALAEATGPRTASPDDGSGPPPPGPPSRSA